MRPDLISIVNRLREEDDAQIPLNEQYMNLSEKERKKTKIQYKQLNIPERYNAMKSGLYDIEYESIADAFPQEYWQAAVDGDWNPFNPPEDMETEAAEKQSMNNYELLKEYRKRGFWSQFKEGFKGMLDSWSMIRGLDNYYAQEEGNSMSDIINDKSFTIYQDPHKPRMKQKAYWAQQWQSMGLSMGIMAEMIPETIAMAGIGKAIKSGVDAAKISRLIKGVTKFNRNVTNLEKVNELRDKLMKATSATERLRIYNEGKAVLNGANTVEKISNIGKTFLLAGTQSAKNAYLNQMYTQNEVYTRLINEGYSDTEARQIALESANKAFKIEMAVNLPLEMLQLGFITKALGKSSVAIGTMKGNLLDELIDKRIKSTAGRLATHIGIGTAIEGGQEVWEEFSSIKGQRIASMKNSYDNVYSAPTDNFDRYIDNFIGGLMGGFLLSGSGKAISEGFHAATGKNKEDKAQMELMEKFERALEPALQNNKSVIKNLRKKIGDIQESAQKKIEAALNGKKESELDEVNDSETIAKLDDIKKNANEEIAKLEKDVAKNSVDLKSLFHTALNLDMLNEQSNNNEDVAKRFAQQVDAADAFLSAYEIAQKNNTVGAFIQSLNNDVNAYYENEKKKDTEEYNKNFEYTNTEKIVKAFEFLYSMDKVNSDEDSFFSYDENKRVTGINDKSIKEYRDLQDSQLNEWLDMSIDFSNYYFGYSLDVRTSLIYMDLMSQARNNDRIYEEVLKNMEFNMPSLAVQLMSRGIAVNGEDIRSHIMNMLSIMREMYPNQKEMIEEFTKGAEQKNAELESIRNNVKKKHIVPKIKNLMLDKSTQEKLFGYVKDGKFDLFNQEISRLNSKERKDAIQTIKELENKILNLTDEQRNTTNIEEDLRDQISGLEKLYSIDRTGTDYISEQAQKLSSEITSKEGNAYMSIMDSMYSNEEDTKPFVDSMKSFVSVLDYLRNLRESAQEFRDKAANLTTNKGLRVLKIEIKAEELLEKVSKETDENALINLKEDLKKVLKQYTKIKPKHLHLAYDEKYLKGLTKNSIYDENGFDFTGLSNENKKFLWRENEISLLERAIKLCDTKIIASRNKDLSTSVADNTEKPIQTGSSILDDNTINGINKAQEEADEIERILQNASADSKTDSNLTAKSEVETNTTPLKSIKDLKKEVQNKAHSSAIRENNNDIIAIIVYDSIGNLNYGENEAKILSAKFKECGVKVDAAHILNIASLFVRIEGQNIVLNEKGEYRAYGDIVDKLYLYRNDSAAIAVFGAFLDAMRKDGDPDWRDVFEAKNVGQDRTVVARTARNGKEVEPTKKELQQIHHDRNLPVHPSIFMFNGLKHVRKTDETVELQSAFMEDGKPLFDKETFAIIHSIGTKNRQGVRFYIKQVDRENIEQEIENRKKITYNNNNSLNDFLNAHPEASLEEQLLHSYTKVYMDYTDENGVEHKGICVGVLNSIDYYTVVSEQESKDMENPEKEFNGYPSNTIPLYYKNRATNMWEKNLKKSLELQEQMKNMLIAVSKASLNGDVELNINTVSPTLGNNINYSQNRKIKDSGLVNVSDSQKIPLFIIGCKKDTVNGRETLSYFGKERLKSGELTDSNIFSRDGLSNFALYLVLDDENGTEVPPARVHVPGVTIMLEPENSDEEVSNKVQSVTDKNIELFSLRKQSPILFNDSVARLKEFAINLLFNADVDVNNNDSIEDFVTKMLENDLLRTFFELSEENKEEIIENLKKLADRGRVDSTNKINGLNVVQRLITGSEKTKSVYNQPGGILIYNETREPDKISASKSGVGGMMIKYDNKVIKLYLGNLSTVNEYIEIPTGAGKISIDKLIEIVGYIQSYINNDSDGLNKTPMNLSPYLGFEQHVIKDGILPNLGTNTDGSRTTNLMVQNETNEDVTMTLDDYIYENGEVNVTSTEYDDFFEKDGSGNPIKRTTIFEDANITFSMKSESSSVVTDSGIILPSFLENTPENQKSWSRFLEYDKENGNIVEQTNNDNKMSEDEKLEMIEDTYKDWKVVNDENGLRSEVQLDMETNYAINGFNNTEIVNLKHALLDYIFKNRPQIAKLLSEGKINIDDMLSIVRKGLKNIGKESGLFYDKIQSIKNEIKKREKRIEKFNDKNAIYVKYGLQQKLAAIESLKESDNIDKLLSVRDDSNDYSMGIFSKYLYDIFGDKLNSNSLLGVDIAEEEEIDTEDNPVSVNENTPTTTLFKKESYLASARADVSTYIKFVFSTIKKSDGNVIDEYYSAYEVLSLLRVVLVNGTSDYKTFKEKIDMLSESNDEIGRLFKQIGTIIDSLPQVLKNELVFKMSVVTHNMKQVSIRNRYDENKKSVVSVSVNNIANQYTANDALRTIKQYMSSSLNPYIIRKEGSGIYTFDDERLLNEIEESKRDVKLQISIIERFLGYKFSEELKTGIDSKWFNASISKLVTLLEDFMSDADTVSGSARDSYKVKRTRKGDRHLYISDWMSQKWILIDLLKRDMDLKPSGIDASLIVNGKSILMTMEKTLKNKILEEIKSRGEYFNIINDLFKGNGDYSNFQTLFMNKHEDSSMWNYGLVSLSALKTSKQESDEITNLSDGDNEICELAFNQQIDELHASLYNEKIKIRTFGGSWEFSSPFRIGYETGLTIADKHKLSWIRMPKLVIPIELKALKDSLGNDYEGLSINLSQLYKYIAEQAVGAYLVRVINEMRNGILRRNSEVNFLIPELNVIKVNNGEREVNIIELLKGMKDGVLDFDKTEKLLKDNYNTENGILEQATDIVENYIKGKIQKLIGISISSEMDIEDIGSLKASDFEEGSWNGNVFEIVNGKLKNKTINESFVAQVVNGQLEEEIAVDDLSNDFNIVYSAIDRVINKFVADMFVQDAMYGQLNQFDSAYDGDIDINSDDKIIEKIFNCAITHKYSAMRMLNKRMAGIEAGGRLGNYDNKLNKEWNIDDILYLCLQETIRMSDDYIYKLRTQYNESRIKALLGNDQTAENLYERAKNGDKDALHELMDKFPIVKDYLNESSSDGQEYITWKEALDNMFARGAMKSDEDYERLYEIYTKLSESEKYIPNEEEQRLLNEYPLNAEKGVYDGAHAIRNEEGKAISVQNVYVKSSAIPLLPQYTRGLKLDSLRKKMEKLQKERKTNVRAAYNSAIKVGTNDAAISIEEACDDKFVIPERALIHGKRKFFSIQQITDNHFVREIDSRNNRIATFRSAIDNIIRNGNELTLVEFIAMYRLDKMDDSELYQTLFNIFKYKRKIGNTITSEQLGTIQNDIKDFLFKHKDKIDYIISTSDVENIDITKSNEDILEELTSDFIDNLDELKARNMTDETYGRILGSGETGVTTRIIEATQMKAIKNGSGFNKIKERIFSLPDYIVREYGDDIEINKEGKYSGIELDRIINKMQQDKTERSQRKLMNDFGVNDISRIEKNKRSFLEKMREQLIDELERRGVSSNIIRDLGIIDLGNGISDFKIPLMMQPSSEKLQSLLLSKVVKTICKSYLPGNAYYVTSQEAVLRDSGVDLSKLSSQQLSQKGMIWIDKNAAQNGLSDARTLYNKKGEIEGFKEADCIISSHFTFFNPKTKRNEVVDFYEIDNDGNFKYIVDDNGNKVKAYSKDGKIDAERSVREANGPLYINKDMIDEEALKMMSLRIPTSGHMSGCLMRIVGIMPPAMGEAMSVPKDHVIQLGEDFDIDKRFCYFKHYEIDENGKIFTIDRNFVNEYERTIKQKENISEILGKIRELRKMKEKTENLSTPANLLLQLVNALDKDILPENEYGGLHFDTPQSIIDNLEELEDKLTNSEYYIERQRKFEKLAKYKNMVFDNDEIDIYFSIFGCPDPRVQKEITKVLGTPVFKYTKEVLTEGKNDFKPYSSPFDIDRQQELRQDNADAKIGVGTSSMAVVLNSLLQQADVRITSFVENNLVIDDLSNRDAGKIGLTNALMDINGHTEEMTIAQILAEIQNSCLDTVKLDLNPYINLNSETINFFIAMALLGFGTANTEKAKGCSLAALIATQPIIKDFVKMKKANKSITSVRTSNNEMLISLIDKYVPGFGERIAAGGMIEINGESFSVRNGMFEANNNNNFTHLKSDKLLDSSRGGDIEKIDGYVNMQFEALALYQMLERIGRELLSFQKILNASSTGIGTNYFEVLNRISILNKFGRTEKSLNPSYTGLTKMIGEFLTPVEYEALSEESQKGFVKVKGCDYYIKPITQAGHILITALVDATALVGDTFNYTSPKVAAMINDLNEKIESLNIQNYEKDKIRRKILREFKQYAYKTIGSEYEFSESGNLFEGMSLEKVEEKILYGEDIYDKDEFDNYITDRLAQIMNDGIISEKGRPMSFAYLKKLLDDTIAQTRLKNNLFWNLFESSGDVIRKRKDKTEYDEESVLHDFMMMWSDINPLKIDDDVNGKVLSTCMLGETMTTLTPHNLAMMMLQYFVVADNANGIMDYLDMIPFEIKEQYYINARISSLYRKLSSLDENEDAVLFVYKNAKGESNTVYANAFIENFKQQFILENKEMIPFFSKYVYSHPSEFGLKFYTETGAEITANIHPSDISTIEINIRKNKEELYARLRIDKDSPMPKHIKMSDNENDYIFELPIDGIDKANGIYTYDKMIVPRSRFGKNQYNPYISSDEVTYETVEENMTSSDISNVFIGDKAIDVLSDMLKHHAIGKYISKFIPYLTKGGKQIFVHFGHGFNKMEKLSDGYHIYLNQKRGMFIGNDLQTQQKNKNIDNIVVEEITHALLAEFILENYKKGSYAILPGKENVPRVQLLKQSYDKISDWFVKNMDRLLENVVQKKQMVHIFSDFQEFLAAFMVLSDDFVSIMKQYEKEHSDELSKSGNWFEKLVEAIKNVLTKIFSSIAKSMNLDLKDNSLVYRIGDEINSIMEEKMEQYEKWKISQDSIVNPDVIINKIKGFRPKNDVVVNKITVEERTHSGQKFFIPHKYMTISNQQRTSASRLGLELHGNGIVSDSQKASMERGNFMDYVSREIARIIQSGKVPQSFDEMSKMLLKSYENYYVNTLHEKMPSLDIEECKKHYKVFVDFALKGLMQGDNFKTVVESIYNQISSFSKDYILISDEVFLMGSNTLRVLERKDASGKVIGRKILDVSIASEAQEYSDLIKSGTGWKDLKIFLSGIPDFVLIKKDGSDIRILDFKTSAGLYTGESRELRNYAIQLDAYKKIIRNILLSDFYNDNMSVEEQNNFNIFANALTNNIKRGIFNINGSYSTSLKYEEPVKIINEGDKDYIENFC